MSKTVPDHIRATVLGRCQFKCERCGIKMMQGLHMSHRQARGMGGALTRKVVPHARPTNINALCSKCHLTHVERNPALAETEGWRVRRGTSPEETPIKTWWGWTYLTDEGGYRPVADSRARPLQETADDEGEVDRSHGHR